MEWSVEDHIHFSALEFGILDNNIRWSGQLKIISTFSAIEIGILNDHKRLIGQLNLMYTFSTLEFAF